MSSGATVLTATTTASSSPKNNNILNNNNNNNANSSASKIPAKVNSTTSTDNAKGHNNTDANGVPKLIANGGDKTASDNSTHVHNNDNNKSAAASSVKSNGGCHTTSLQQNGNLNGCDTVDKAAVQETESKLIEGGGEMTTTKADTSKEAANGINGGATVPVQLLDAGGDVSRSDSRTSCNSLNGSTGHQDNDDSGNALEGAAVSSQNSTTGGSTAAAASSSDTLKKKQRMSSGRQQTKKAKRVRFYRNGDKFYPGLMIPVSNERYRSFESLTEDLTRVLGESIKVPGAVRTIFTVEGKRVASLEELEDGKCYVCSCNNEVFRRLEYSQNNKLNNRLSRVFRPSSPHKNGGSPMISGGSANGTTTTNGSMPSPTVNLSERDTVVFPRIVTLIRNGVKPRRIFRLLLNKRNSPSFEHVLTAITQRVNLDTGCVRKVFSLDGGGMPVLTLADFFQHDVDVFFAYGNERVGGDDFELDAEELRQIHQLHRTLKSSGKLLPGAQKPKMPGKSHNETFECVDENFLMIGLQGNDSLPAEIRNKYTIGQVIGDGNFAVVLRVTEKNVAGKEFALKIIDKSKCLGKEHYIDAEIRIMKQLQHPHIISLVSDKDTARHMYLVMELVNGGDLFDAITRVTRFGEGQARVMIKHLASAMAYLHSLGIVHRDIKPENLLVELDEHGNVMTLKLADFGLACEVDEPLLAVCGTPTYVAPEILMETGYGLKIDVWAAGIILYILLCGFPPFVSPDNQQEPLFDAILSGVYDFPEPYWTDIGDGVRDLIANMLQSDPELRFSSEDILDHFWVLEEEEGGQYAH